MLPSADELSFFDVPVEGDVKGVGAVSTGRVGILGTFLAPFFCRANSVVVVAVATLLLFVLVIIFFVRSSTMDFPGIVLCVRPL